MSIEHVIRCNAVLPGGHTCESRSLTKNPSIPPAGWTTVTRWEKTELATMPGLGYMSPVIEALKAKEQKKLDKGEEVEGMSEAVEATFAGLAEHAPPSARTAHICDKHELPEMKFETCNHGIYGC